MQSLQGLLLPRGLSKAGEPGYSPPIPRRLQLPPEIPALVVFAWGIFNMTIGSTIIVGILVINGVSAPVNLPCIILNGILRRPKKSSMKVRLSPRIRLSFACSGDKSWCGGLLWGWIASGIVPVIPTYPRLLMWLCAGDYPPYLASETEQLVNHHILFCHA